MKLSKIQQLAVRVVQLEEAAKPTYGNSNWVAKRGLVAAARAELAAAVNVKAAADAKSAKIAAENLQILTAIKVAVKNFDNKNTVAALVAEAAVFVLEAKKEKAKQLVSSYKKASEFNKIAAAALALRAAEKEILQDKLDALSARFKLVSYYKTLMVNGAEIVSARGKAVMAGLDTQEAVVSYLETQREVLVTLQAELLA